MNVMAGRGPGGRLSVSVISIFSFLPTLFHSFTFYDFL